MWSSIGKIYKYEFRLYLQNLSGICKMGITFAYELGLKVFYMKNHLRPVCKFVESSNSKRKKSYAQISVFLKKFIKSGQTMVKLLIQEVLVLLNNYSRILVLLNNYFSFFEFWSNLVKLWSNCGQTMVKLLIQEILVLLNNYCFLEQ